MELLHSYTNSLGLLDNLLYPYWLDHVLNDWRGVNFNLNGHYLGALDDFAEILKWIDEPGSENFRARAELLRKSLQTHFWDEKKQLFTDALIFGERSEMFSEHANAMALAMNVASPEQGKIIGAQLLKKDKHNYILRESGISMVTPAMSYFLHKGLCNYGYIDQSLEMFRNRFDKMLAPGSNGTLWEEWWLDAIGRSGKLQKGRTRSDAQTESAFAPALFAEYLLGVQPLNPGWKEVEISRLQSGLKNLEAKIPTPEGILIVNWNINNKVEGALDVEIPGNITVKIDLLSIAVINGKQIMLNGNPLPLNIINRRYLFLSQGIHKLQF